MKRDENLVPKRRFNEFENDGTWEQRKVGELCEIVAGGTPSTSNERYWNPRLIPWLSSGEVHKKRIYYTDNMISQEGFDNSSAKWVKINSVLIALAGQGKTRGTVAISNIPLTTNQSIAAMVPNDGLSYEYLFQNLESRYDEIRILSSADGSRGGLNKQMVSDITIKLPQIEEQMQIGTFFKTLDNLITLHQRKLKKLKDLKSAYLSDMFPKEGVKYPKIRFADYTDPWERHKIKEIFKVTRGDVLAATKTMEKKTEKMPYPVYSSQTKNNGLMGYYKEFLYENAITWTTDGANAGTVNYRGGKFYCTNVCGVLLSNEGYANKMVSEGLNKIAWKHVSKVGNPKLMNNIMGEIIVYLPKTVAEQKLISDFFEQLDNLITLNQQKLEKLQNLKKAYLNEMFV